MKIFYAGVPGGGSSGDCKRERELVNFWNCRLWTYYWLKKENAKMDKDKKITLFLDSGAFSAWTKGEDVDIHDYIKFIKEHRQVIDVYANLDVIGIGGKQPNAKTAELTLRNQKIMEKAGLDPIPVFHIGEPMNYLEYYVQKYDYISLGIAGNLPANLIEWMDECFAKYICDSNGYPKVKVHGFAVTSLVLMLRYPWYSVDSTSWVTIGRNGKIIVPKRKNGQWVYDDNADKISVSYKSPDIHKKGQHIFNIQGPKKERVLQYIEEKGYKLGKSTFEKIPADSELKENQRWAEKKSDSKMRLVENIVVPGLSNQYLLRDELNIIYFNDLQETIPEWPWPFKRDKFSLF